MAIDADRKFARGYHDDGRACTAVDRFLRVPALIVLVVIPIDVCVMTWSVSHLLYSVM